MIRAFGRLYYGLVRLVYFRTVTIAILLILLAFELSVFGILALFPYLPDPGLTSLNERVYTFLEPLSVVLLLVLLYLWLVKLFTLQARRRSARFDSFVRFFGEPVRRIVSSLRSTSLREAAGSVKFLGYPTLMLVLGLILGVFLAFIPYRPDLNPTGRLVGVDSPSYLDWINQMLARQPDQALRYSFISGLNGSRPLLLILLYGIASTGVSTTTILECLPIFLSPLLSLSTYMFVKYGQGSPEIAGLASLFTPISFYTSVGLWGG